MSTKVLQLISIGNPLPQLLRDLEEPLLTQLSLQISISKNPQSNPVFAFNKDRNQYYCNAVMRRLIPLLEPGQAFVMAITDVDIFVPDGPFIIGEADRESRTAVLSTFRLQGPGGQLKRRLMVEALHQGGHLLGLSYCEDARCLMFLAQNAAEVDRKTGSLCNVCRNELVKLLK
jgi:archaemetzincin